MHGIQDGLGYDFFKYHRPEQLPIQEEDVDWPNDPRIYQIEEEIFGGEQEETFVSRLTEDWTFAGKTFPAGSLVLSGLEVEGHPFVIIPTM